MPYLVWNSGTIRTTTGVLEAGPIWHPGIVIRWRDGDFGSATTTTFGIRTPTGTGVGSGPAPSASPSHVNFEPRGSGGLSTGAKIGIGIGVPLFVLQILLITFFVWRRRRKHLAAANHLGTAPGEKSRRRGRLRMIWDGKPKELDGREVGERHELENTQRGVFVVSELEPTTTSPGSGKGKAPAAGAWSAALNGQNGARYYTYDGLPSWSPTTPVLSQVTSSPQGAIIGNNNSEQAGNIPSREPQVQLPPAGVPTVNPDPALEARLQEPPSVEGQFSPRPSSPPPLPPKDVKHSTSKSRSEGPAKRESELERKVRELEQQTARLEARMKNLLAIKELEEEEERIRVLKEKLKRDGV